MTNLSRQMNLQDDSNVIRQSSTIVSQSKQIPSRAVSQSSYQQRSINMREFGHNEIQDDD